jgi:hypothetical protein
MTQEQLNNLQSVGATLLSFVSPAVILRAGDRETEEILHNGTLSYVSTGESTLLVTSAHVWDEFAKLKQSDDRIRFAWYPAQGVAAKDLSTYEPTGHNRSQIDLCTFAVDLPTALPTIGKKWANVLEWPPGRPSVGDRVIGVGFPGANRTEQEVEGNRSLVMVASVVSGTVGSVSDRHFVVSDENAERFMLNIGDGSYVPQFGGMSGGVFFRVRETDEDIFLDLAGFLYEVYDVHGEGHDVHASLYVTHADFILGSGKLDYSRIP